MRYKPTYKNFEDYLQSKHMEGYTGCDDDFPESFEKMLSGLDYGYLALFAMDYADLYPTVKEDKLNEAERWIKILLE